MEENSDINESGFVTDDTNKEIRKTLHLTGMYKDWFLDYASYVILERAVPEVIDGLKPVQRRILHAMKELDDGRYNKVANIIGHTMKYHPHGDASIGDALVQLGQKDLLIDCQGNWGNVHTGDSAAAPRYIEARLSKFALDVVFNPKTTNWKPSYDGRNKEPKTLPVKFPLLLFQGVEGIAVGLASKILPHNFIELIEASINILEGKDFEILPDFPTGGMADVTKYNDGLRGGKVRIRAKINQLDKKTLVITELPFGVNTSTLIDSIIVANDKGKIKIRKIDDNTARDVEILIHLAPGISPDTTIDALYAFTNCEVSVSPNSCVIDNGKPMFTGIREILKISTENTVALLKLELEIEKNELQEQWHYISLERIFIENEVYEDMKKCKTDAEINIAIDSGLKPYTKNLLREVTLDDILKLRKIPIDRISKYNSDKTNDVISAIEDDIKQVDYDLTHLTQYAIDFFQRILKKYAKGKERKTELRNFEVIEATMVAVANEKLYVNKIEGFAGTGLKKDDYVGECSDIDDIIVFRKDGSFIVTKVAEKVFVGQNIEHIAVFRRNDERTIYNMIYQDGLKGSAYVKRFAVVGVTRDKEYDLTKGSKNSSILYFTANANGEAEVVKVILKPKPKLKKTIFDFDFSELAIKGRSSQGNILTKHLVKKVSLKDEGISTLGARNIWYDETVMRLNTENRGIYLGAFKPTDKILCIMKSGYYRLMSFDLTNHFDEDLMIIEKFNPEKIISAVYYDGEVKKPYVKRFLIEESDKKQDFLGEHPNSFIYAISNDWLPQLEVIFDEKINGKHYDNEIIQLADFIGVKGFKAKGKRLAIHAVKEVQMLDPLPYENENTIELSTEIEEIEEIESKSDAVEEIEKASDYQQDDDDEPKQMTLF
ncbi:MAG: DNA gyrase/topoisomerase IV subunit A [Bacteroidetes bacterium]|nr:DNA gyrase/topoisomerase IV subunit A [Bacteroidota bacterium]